MGLFDSLGRWLGGRKPAEAPAPAPAPAPARKDPIAAIGAARRAHAAELETTPAQRAAIYAVFRDALDANAHDYLDLLLASPQRERVAQRQVEVAMEAYFCGLMARRGWIDAVDAQQGAFFLGRKLRDEIRALGVDLAKVSANFGTVVDRALLSIVEREFPAEPAA